jgi:hypothetical protein
MQDILAWAGVAFMIAAAVCFMLAGIAVVLGK